MWGWLAAQTEEAACGVETGAGHKRRKKQEQGGREDRKRGGKRLRKWGAAAQFQEAASIHLGSVEHAAVQDLEGSPKVPNSGAPS